MKTILLDTNFIIYCYKNKIRIQEEISRNLDESFEISILDKCMEELKKVSEEVYKFTNKLNFKIIPSEYPEKYADFNLLHMADKDIIIATNDKQLKENLKKRSFPVFVVRQKNHINLI